MLLIWGFGNIWIKVSIPSLYNTKAAADCRVAALSAVLKELLWQKCQLFTRFIYSYIFRRWSVGQSDLIRGPEFARGPPVEYTCCTGTKHVMWK